MSRYSDRLIRRSDRLLRRSILLRLLAEQAIAVGKTLDAIRPEVARLDSEVKSLNQRADAYSLEVQSAQRSIEAVRSSMSSLLAHSSKVGS